MAEDSKSSGLSFLRDPILRHALILAAALAVALFIARAPTSYTGELPLVGKYVPLKLNAVYIIVFGPILATIVSGALWIEASARVGREVRGRPRKGRRNLVLLALVFGAVVVLAGLLSLQYFLILAPAELCATRPHYDFLWTNLHGQNRMVHCMSGTDEINKSSPFYVEPQILQAWVHVLCPAVTFGLLAAAWRRLARQANPRSFGHRKGKPVPRLFPRGRDMAKDDLSGVPAEVPNRPAQRR